MKGDPQPGLPPGRSWWSRRWVVMAAGFTLAQFVGFWLLSPEPAVPQPPRLRRPFLVAPAEAPDGAEGTERGADLALLLTPGLFLIPLSQGFSGSGWLASGNREVTLDAFAAADRALPFAPVPIDAGAAGSWRRDPGRGDRGITGAAEDMIPSATPVPLSPRVQLAVLAGAPGWELVEPPATARPPTVAPVARAVLRVMITAAGEVASPPTLWESSGDPAADAAALALASQVGFRRPGDVAPDGPGELAWFLVGVEWPPAAAP